MDNAATAIETEAAAIKAVADDASGEAAAASGEASGEAVAECAAVEAVEAVAADRNLQMHTACSDSYRNHCNPG